MQQKMYAKEMRLSICEVLNHYVLTRELQRKKNLTSADRKMLTKKQHLEDKSISCRGD